MIDVTLIKSEDPYEFDVTVRERGTETRHRVTMADATYRQLAGERATPERVIEAAVRETGRRYRDTVLALGGSIHPGEVFSAFRGRDARTDALLRHSGLAR